jgi:magnesium transporter
MRVLTIIAFVTFPLMLFAALFGMSNMVSMPIVGTKGDFWIIVGLMLISAFVLLWYFRRKKWL